MEMLSKELNIFILLYSPIHMNNDNYMKMVYTSENVNLDKVVEKRKILQEVEY